MMLKDVESSVGINQKLSRGSTNTIIDNTIIDKPVSKHFSRFEGDVLLFFFNIKSQWKITNAIKYDSDSSSQGAQQQCISKKSIQCLQEVLY